MEKTSFETLPVEIQTDILSRLPLKSLVIWICTSKKWASIIRTQEFTDLYMRRSMTRPRMMFMIFQTRSSQYKVLFQSVYQEEKPLLSSGQQQVILSPNRRYVISQHVQGLICLRKNTKVMIFNPGTNKSLPLPEIPVPQKEAAIRSYFGYDGLTDVYKVLCIAKFEVKRRSKVTEEQHILTMGSGEEAWRRITCEHHHSPVTNRGICTGGVLYYRARSNRGKPLVMRFKVRTEELSVIELPEDFNTRHGWDLMHHAWELVNYNGVIALVDDTDFSRGVVNESNGNKVFYIWVRNETAGNWSRTRIEIPRWKEIVENPTVYFFRGTTTTGKLVFSLKHSSPTIDGKRSLYVVYYDPGTRDLKRFKIEGWEERFEIEGGEEGHHHVLTFLDHVDTPMLI